MTVSSTTNRKEYAGDGVTTSFATSPLTFDASSTLTVYAVVTATGVSTTLVENTNYTVSGGSGSTGTINTAGGSSPYGAPASTITLVIVRTEPLTQAADFVNNDPSDAEVQEAALDKLTRIAQQLDADRGRSLRLASSDVSGLDTSLATPVAGGYLRVNVGGTGTEWVDVDIESEAPGFTQSGTGAVERTWTSKAGEIVSVKDFGATGDGTTDDTAAFAAAIAAAKGIYVPNGTYLVDTVALIPATTAAQGKHLFGQSRQHTIIKGSASATKLLDVEGGAVQAIGMTVERLRLDMTNMADSATVYGLYTKTGWNCAFREIDIIGYGSSNWSYYSAEGFYTSRFECVDFGSTTGRVKLLGVSLGDAVTTLTFQDCQLAYFNAQYVSVINLLACTFQGALDKLTLANTLGVQAVGCDIEGTGTYLVLGTGVDHLYTSNEISAFSGTYSSGTLSTGVLMDFSGSAVMGITGQSGGYKLTDTPLTLTKTAASLMRTVIQNTNATDQEVDLQMQNDGGSNYFGTLSTGEAFIDARGAIGEINLMIGGTTYAQVESSAGNFTPGADNTNSCGMTGLRWASVWAANGTIQTSDERQKSIYGESDLGLDFVKATPTIRYVWKVGQNKIEVDREAVAPELVKAHIADGWKVDNALLPKDFDPEKLPEGFLFPMMRERLVPIPGKRTHYGFGAQTIKSRLGEKDAAFYIKDAVTGEEGLRSAELLSVLWKAVQELTAKVERLEQAQ